MIFNLKMFKTTVFGLLLSSQCVLMAHAANPAPPPPPPPQDAMQADAPPPPDGMKPRMQQRWQNLTPEQQAKMQQRQAQRKAEWQQVQQACKGKTVGQAIQVKIGERLIDGKCEIRFVKNRA